MANLYHPVIDDGSFPSSPDTRNLCAVCGDSASGMHYGVQSCEACKLFFYRNARRPQTLLCIHSDSAEGECNVTWKDRYCLYCRMKRCLAVGMQMERLWKKRDSPPHPPPHQSSIHPNNTVKTMVNDANLQAPQHFAMTSPLFGIRSISDTHQPLVSALLTAYIESMPLGNEQAKLLMEECKLVFIRNYAPQESVENICSLFQEMSTCDSHDDDVSKQRWNIAAQSCSPHQINGGTVSPREMPAILNSGHQVASSSRFPLAKSMQMMGVFLMMTEVLSTFCKSLPGFTDLSISDQAILVKGVYVEFVCYVATRRFDVKQRCINSVVMPGSKVPLSSVVEACFPDAASVVGYAEEMNQLQLTLEEFVMILAIHVFSPDRRDLSDSARSMVRVLQEKVISALMESSKLNHTHNSTKFIKKVVTFMMEFRKFTRAWEVFLEQFKFDMPFVQPKEASKGQ